MLLVLLNAFALGQKPYRQEFPRFFIFVSPLLRYLTYSCFPLLICCILEKRPCSVWGTGGGRCRSSTAAHKGRDLPISSLRESYPYGESSFCRTSAVGVVCFLVGRISSLWRLRHMQALVLLCTLHNPIRPACTEGGVWRLCLFVCYEKAVDVLSYVGMC